MPYEELNFSNTKPVLSWANHELGFEETHMAKNVASLPFVYKHVALMPDVHLGKGALVGSVIATKDAIIPAAVGVDIGCFTGDTLIPLVDGKSYPIAELAEKARPVFVYSCTPSGKVVATEALARLTRHQAPLVKVILDNGEEIKCTPDHLFMTRNGEYQEAQNLLPDTSLMPFYSKLDRDGYTLIQQNYSGRWQKANSINQSQTLDFDEYVSFDHKNNYCYNHKVVAVIPLNETQDVYCLSVPEYHNFALKAGVFVHNCGMSAIKLPFNANQLEGKLKKIRLDIEANIPVGFNENKDAETKITNWQGWQGFKDLHSGVQRLESKAIKQLGSLGGGNHFIELCLDTENQVWLMLHSGSRHIGNQLAECHIKTGKQLAKLANIRLPDPDLAYFIAGTPEFEAYWRDLQWAQNYARFNRDVMMSRFKAIVEKHLNGGKVTKPLLTVNCHHNYAEKEHHFGEDVYVTRKGAVRATEEDYGIIPGSMGAKSFIVKGKGNHDSFCSCFAGNTQILTEYGLMSIESVYNSDSPIKLVSYNEKLQKFELKEILEQSCRSEMVNQYSFSQTRRRLNNNIVCTANHPFATYEKGEITYQPIEEIFNNQGGVIIPSQISFRSNLSIEDCDANLYYLLGVILSEEKPLSELNISDAKFIKKAIKIRENLPQILLTNPYFSLYFLAGYLDGNGSINRDTISISVGKISMFNPLICALLSLGIAYKVYNNRNNYVIKFRDNLVITKLADICQRLVINEPPKRLYGDKLLLAKSLTGGKIYHPKLNDYGKNDKMLNIEKLCHESLNSTLAMNRVVKSESLSEIAVYNFTVADNHNYIIFTDYYTPILVHNCSHGAGRKMSRTQAKKRFDVHDLVMQTEGIECRKDSGVVDEIPSAYKSIEEVMNQQTDLVEVVATLKQVVCVKG
ncbi:RtcB family protein [Geminocystis sp. CENA526]|uniref:RtcB family protein n=1 Tax=Geminocystis sp. CENA526 TaxID=1355871 RepID=UPI003D6F86E6